MNSLMSCLRLLFDSEPILGCLSNCFSIFRKEPSSFQLTNNSLPVLLSSWNYGDMYAKYQSERISLKKSQICLLSQQKCNKTVQVHGTIIQPGKELSVVILIHLAEKQYYLEYESRLSCCRALIRTDILISTLFSLRNCINGVFFFNFSCLMQNTYDHVTYIHITYETEHTGCLIVK